MAGAASSNTVIAAIIVFVTGLMFIHSLYMDQKPVATDPMQALMVQDSCTCEQGEYQEHKVKDFVKENVWYWGCPSDIWWEMIHAWSPSTDKVFLDLGMNKGYTAAEWFNLWNPSSGLNPPSLHEGIRKIPPQDEQDCGACSDCSGKAASAGNEEEKKGLIKVIGYDANELAIDKHGAIVRDFFADLKENWISVHSAVSAEVKEKVQFPKLTFVSEIASLGSNVGSTEGQEMVDVHQTNGVEIWKKHKLQRVFALKTDVEGFDADVIQGFDEQLREHLVTVLTFEYHKGGSWRETSLAAVAGKLDKYGYECYLVGHKCLVSLSNTCWSSTFERRDWSNVFCLSRLDAAELIERFDAQSFAKNSECEK